LGAKTIHRKELFNQMKIYMYEKDPTDREEEKNHGFSSLYKEEFKKMKDAKSKDNTSEKNQTKPSVKKIKPNTITNSKLQRQAQTEKEKSKYL